MAAISTSESSWSGHTHQEVTDFVRTEINKSIKSSDNSIAEIIRISQSDYEALSTKVSTTLYIVIAE